MLVGSCRSIEGVDIFKVQSSAAELMEKFGVRTVALNFAIVENRMKLAEEECAAEIGAVEAYIRSNYHMDELTPKYVHGMATMVVTV